MSRLPSLDLKVRRAVVEMFARGYTVRTIRPKLTALLNREPSDDELLRLAIDYAGDVEEYRREIAKDAVTRGLAAKEERIMRLRELAEDWEEKARSDVRSAHVYLKTLKQIQEEVEPLGIMLMIPTSDPWGQLLNQLKETATREQVASEPTD